VRKLKIENWKFKNGFTLIELLIVITLLGILAVAVLSAINPVEQMNRSRDTASRSDAEQLINAIDRFYSTKGYYPWRTGAGDVEGDGTAPVDWTQITADAPADGNGESVAGKLSGGETGTGEVKESFISRVTAGSYNPLFIYNNGGQGDSTYVCFLPKSASFSDDAGKRCDGHVDFGALPTDYPAEACPDGCSDTKTCYSCLP